MLSNPSQSTVADGEEEEEDGELREVGEGGHQDEKEEESEELREVGEDGEDGADEGQDEKVEESGEVGQGKKVGADGDEDPSKFHNWKGRGAAQMILHLLIKHPKVRSFKEELKTIFKLSPDEQLGGSSCQLQQLAFRAGDEA